MACDKGALGGQLFMSGCPMKVCAPVHCRATNSRSRTRRAEGKFQFFSITKWKRRTAFWLCHVGNGALRRPAVGRFGFFITTLLFRASGLGRISHPGATASTRPRLGYPGRMTSRGMFNECLRLGERFVAATARGSASNAVKNLTGINARLRIFNSEFARLRGRKTCDIHSPLVSPISCRATALPTDTGSKNTLLGNGFRVQRKLPSRAVQGRGSHLLRN